LRSSVVGGDVFSKRPAVERSWQLNVTSTGVGGAPLRITAPGQIPVAKETFQEVTPRCVDRNADDTTTLTPI